MSPGFGSSPFGGGSFGEWPWADTTILGSLPDIYKQLDDEVGKQRLQQLLQTLSPSFDYIRRKIDSMGDLRDPLLAPTDKAFDEPVRILQVTDLGDGTSRVFISEGADGSKFKDLRVGYVLIDSTGNRFNIVTIVASGQAKDYSDAPIDPATGQKTGKHLIVDNLSFDTTQTIPWVSGLAQDEAHALLGSAPYTITVLAPPMEKNKIRLTWTEGSTVLVGYILNTGEYTNPLTVGTVVDWATGSITFSNISQVPLTSVSVSYTQTFPGITPVEDTEDAVVNSPHILAYLGQDFGVDVDRHDPETLQRAYVQHATELWGMKSTADSYAYLGAIAGFYVSAKGLYRIDASYVPELPPFNVYEIPASSGKWYTDIAPVAADSDEIACDVFPLDTVFTDFTPITQNLVVTASALVRYEGSLTRYSVEASSTEMHLSFNTFGEFTDAASNGYPLENFRVTSPSTVAFEVLGATPPILGAATIDWQAYAEPITISSSDITVIGRQYLGYAGFRYRIKVLLSSLPGGVSSVGYLGNWAIIDSYGTMSWVELAEEDVSYLYLDVIAEDPPASSVGGLPASLSYTLPISTTCDYCRASLLRVEISAAAILATPEALAEDALGRLINRLQQLVPAHVRVAEYVYGPGPAVAAFLPFVATSEITEIPEDDAEYVAYFDEDEYPADEIPTDLAILVASSEVTITSTDVLEEHVDGTDPFTTGWTGTGLWHVTGYRSSTGFKSFNYGHNEAGRVGDVGAVPPDFDTGAQTLGALKTPVISAIAAATTVTLRFRHFADMESGLVKDLPSVVVKTSPGGVTLATFAKAALGLDTTGNTGGVFVTVSLDLTASVVGAGAFTVEFAFDSVDALNNTTECWYIDDIEVQVIP